MEAAVELTRCAVNAGAYCAGYDDTGAICRTKMLIVRSTEHYWKADLSFVSTHDVVLRVSWRVIRNHAWSGGNILEVLKTSSLSAGNSGQANVCMVELAVVGVAMHHK